MNDNAETLKPPQNLKRSLDEIEPESFQETQAPRLEEELVKLHPTGETAGTNGTDTRHEITTDISEPLSKKQKLENGTAALPKVDSRDKVRGIALVKEE